MNEPKEAHCTKCGETFFARSIDETTRCPTCGCSGTSEPAEPKEAPAKDARELAYIRQVLQSSVRYYGGKKLTDRAEGARTAINKLARLEARLASARLTQPTESAQAPDALTVFLARYIQWSTRTFGAGRRTLGILKHIEKEIAEVKAKPEDLTEWIDITILAIDGYWRHGGNPETILSDLTAKAEKNYKRVYPMPTSEDEPSEHIWENEPSESGQGEADEAFMELAEIFKNEAEYRDMILWTPMNPRKEVQGLTRNDIELIFSPARVYNPVRDFLQSLLAGRQPERAEPVTMGCINPLVSTGPKETWAEVHARAEKAEIKAKALREALEYYANPQNWLESYGVFDGYFEDPTAPARAALREDDARKEER
jgi:uncharacterized Zn finger protein (UPF0148 family)